MKKNNTIPFYDPNKSYEDNFENGPFGDFTTKETVTTLQKPTHIFLGHPVHLPFGIAAGPLLNGKYIKAAMNKGFDLVVYKTVRTNKYACHSWPNVVAVHVKDDLKHAKALEGIQPAKNQQNPTAITNSFGVPSFDPSFWQQDMKDCVEYAKPGQIVIGSFQGTTKGNGDIQAYIEDFALAAKLVKETGVKIFEANLSCPNEGTGHLLCFDIDRTKKIVEAIRKEIGDLPLILKLAYFEDQEYLRTFVKTLGEMVQAFSAINTIPAKIIDTKGNQVLPGKGRLISGVCGSPIQWAGLEMVERLKSLKDEFKMDYTIIGVGGVMNALDYQKFRQAGADAVMCATGAMWNAYLAKEIKQAEGIL